jgi:lysophospholipase L1-like esterase
MSNPGFSFIWRGRLNATPTTGARIMSKRGTTGAGWEFGISTWPNWEIKISDGTTTITAGGASIPVGAKVTLTGVYDRTASKIRVGVNGVEQETSASGLGDCSNTLPMRFFAGAEATPARFCDATFTSAEIYTEALSAAEIQTILGSLTQVLAFEGDSQTANGGGGSMPNRVMNGLSSSPTFYNHGRGGDQLINMNNEASTQVDPTIAGSNSTLVLWAGTNDLYYGETGASTLALMESYVNARHDAGWKNIVILTCLPRTTTGQAAGYETERQVLNNGIRAASWYDALVDVAADSRIGDQGDQNDLTYYLVDTTHLNATGRQVVADLVIPVLNNLGIE